MKIVIISISRVAQCWTFTQVGITRQTPLVLFCHAETWWNIFAVKVMIPGLVLNLIHKCWLLFEYVGSVVLFYEMVVQDSKWISYCFYFSQITVLELLEFQNRFYWTERIARADFVFSVPRAVWYETRPGVWLGRCLEAGSLSVHPFQIFFFPTMLYKWCTGDEQAAKYKTSCPCVDATSDQGFCAGGVAEGPVRC